MGQKVIVDSDILVALFKPDDSSHPRAISLVQKLKDEGRVFSTLNLVVYESVTVVSNRMGMEAAKRFHLGLENFIDEIIQFDEKLEEKTWEIFLSQTKKDTSFVDCANLAVIEIYKFNGILSFDRFYGDKLIR